MPSGNRKDRDKLAVHPTPCFTRKKSKQLVFRFSFSSQHSPHVELWHLCIVGHAVTWICFVLSLVGFKAELLLAVP